MPYYYNPHAGGIKIPTNAQERVRSRILAHAAAKYAGQFESIEVRFRGALCYIDAIAGSPPSEFHLVRLRYFSDMERWSLAFYTYSNERYEPCVFHDGTFQGTPEDAFDIGAVYLGGV